MEKVQHMTDKQFKITALLIQLMETIREYFLDVNPETETAAQRRHHERIKELTESISKELR